MLTIITIIITVITIIMIIIAIIIIIGAGGSTTRCSPGGDCSTPEARGRGWKQRPESATRQDVMHRQGDPQSTPHMDPIEHMLMRGRGAAADQAASSS